jgi:hypothetical protein
MSWGAQNRSKDAKTPSTPRGRSENPEPGLWPDQPYRVRVEGTPVELGGERHNFSSK